MKDNNTKSTLVSAVAPVVTIPAKHIVLGLSKREQIATSVLQAILSNEKYLGAYDQPHIVSLALSYTDALILALGTDNEKV